ncbi:MAG: diguanylate cyclase [Actinobacteria bacterium]|nr:diguanylate cyclase [Actinomycetota bacterium]
MAKASKNLRVSADRLAESFSERVDAAAAKLRTLASSSQLADSCGSSERMLSQLRLMEADSETFEELFLIGADGSILASTFSMPKLFSLPSPSDMSSGISSAIRLSDAQPEGFLFTSLVPCPSESAPVLLVGFVLADKLAVEVEQFGLGYSGLAILADSRDRILACSLSELLGKHLSVLNRPLLGSDSSSGSQADGRDGGNYHVVSRSLSDDPDSLRILVAQSRAEILESSLESSSWSLITVVVITPIVLLLGLIFTGSVRRSLDSLITGTRRIAQGDFSPLDVPRPYWEIGELAKSFEQMKDSLSKNRQRLLQYQMGLEDLVAQKTRQLHQSERKYRTLYESSRDALMLIAPTGKFLSGNAAAVNIFGFRNEKEFASTTLAQCSPDYQPDGTLSSDKAQQMLNVAIKDGSHFFDWISKRFDGVEFVSTILLTKIELDDEEVVLQATVRDVTEDKRLQDMLVEQAEIDQLTGLFNRRALLTSLRQSWARRQRYSQEFSLIMIDIDQFKLVNDTYGHQAGDEVLQQVAQAILSRCRESDFAARYGGEEFAVVLANTDAEEAVALAQRCRCRIEDMVFTFQGHTVKLTASFGVADAGDLLSTEALIQRADEALYRAKRAGRNRVELLAHTQSAT